MNTTIRKRLYWAFDIIGSGLAITEAGFLAAHHQPVWLTVALAVYGAMSARVHGIASKRVTDTVTKPLP